MKMDEYKALLLKLKMSFKKTLEDKIKGFIVYGSYAKGTYIQGESDLDMILVLKDEPPEEHFKTLIEVNKILAKYWEDPNAYMMDLEVISEKDVPTGNFEMDLFNPIKAHEISKGQAELGENIFAGLTIPREKIKESARRWITENIAMLKNGIVAMNLESMDIIYLAIDVTLNTAMALLYWFGEENFDKISAAELLQEKYGSKIDANVAIEAHHLRFGATPKDKNMFLKQVLNFCNDAFELVSK